MSIVNPVPLREPQVIAAGDTAQWYRQLADFSAEDWSLNYVLTNKGNIYKFSASNDAGLFYVNLTSVITAEWLPGLYAIGAYVTNDDAEQKQVRTAFATLTVTPNLATNPNGIDPTPWPVKVLASIEETIAQLTARTVTQASVNGNAYSLANIGELFKLRERFKSEVRRLEMQARLNAGLGAGNKIGVRFRTVGSTQWPPNFGVPWQ